MKSKILIALAFLAMIVSPAFASAAVQITSSNFPSNLQAGSNNNLSVNFSSVATIPINVIFRLSLNRTTNITSEFNLSEAYFNGVPLKIIPVINGSLETWYIMNTSNSSSTIIINPQSSNYMNFSLFVHPATEPENVHFNFTVDTDDVLVDVDKQIQYVPGSVQTIYINHYIPNNVTTIQNVTTIVEKIPQNISDALKSQSDTINLLKGALQNVSQSNDNNAKENANLKSSQATQTYITAASLIALLTSLGYIGVMHLRARKIISSASKSLSD